MKYRVQTDGKKFIVQRNVISGLWATEHQSVNNDPLESKYPIYFDTQDEAVMYIDALLNPPGKVAWKTVYEVEQ